MFDSIWTIAAFCLIIFILMLLAAHWDKKDELHRDSCNCRQGRDPCTCHRDDRD